MSSPAFWIGRTLQMSGLATVLYALPAGMWAEESMRMTWELGLLALGSAIFALGRLIEGSRPR